MNLPNPLICLTLQHIFNDRDTMEKYLQADPVSVKKCMPIVIRDVLNEYAVPAGLVPMKIPDSATLLKYLQSLWHDENVNKNLVNAIKENAIYLVPYFLMNGAIPLGGMAPGVAGADANYTEAVALPLLYALNNDIEILKLLLFPPTTSHGDMWKRADINRIFNYSSALHEYVFSDPVITDLILAARPDKESIFELTDFLKIPTEQRDRLRAYTAGA